MDDLEQYGRRTSVRVEGLEFVEGETADGLFEKVRSNLEKVDIDLKETDVIRMHRSAKPVEKNGKVTAQTIIKMSNWKIRERMQGVNKACRAKKLSFRVNGDLTARRYKLLASARERIFSMLSRKYSKELIAKLPDEENVFAFANVNSKLRIRARKQIFKFNNEEQLDKIIREVFPVG